MEAKVAIIDLNNIPSGQTDAVISSVGVATGTMGTFDNPNMAPMMMTPGKQTAQANSGSMTAPLMIAGAVLLGLVLFRR